jgi:hypothetical protein
MLRVFDGKHVVADLHLVGAFTTDQFAVTHSGGNSFIALTEQPVAPLPPS